MPLEESASVPSKSKQYINSHELLKFAAIITMVVDHIGVFYLNDAPWARTIGRFAAPCFFFLIGYTKSTNKDYSLLVWGLLISLVRIPAFWNIQANILISFFLYRAFAKHFKLSQRTNLEYCLLIALLAFAEEIIANRIEYGSVGWLWCLAGFFVAEGKTKLAIAALTTVTAFQGYSSMIFINMEPYVLFSVFGICSLCFLGYKFETYEIKSKPVQWIANQSLVIYVVHYVGFNIHKVVKNFT